jgi:hypothetical protein
MADPVPQTTGFRRTAAGRLGGMLVTLAFLLPLKFGSTAALPEVPSFPPPSVLAWLIFLWPPILFPVLSGLLLGGTVLLLPPPRRTEAPGLVALAWTLLAAVTLLGVIGATTADFATLQLGHMLGLAAFAAAAWRILALRPDLRPWLLGALVLGTLMASLHGLHQYFLGFAETRAFVADEETRTGVAMMQGNFGQRLMENRISATFAICNSFAAHLGLMLPVCIVALWGNPRLQRVALATLASVAAWLTLTAWDTVPRQFGFSALYVGAMTLALVPWPETWRKPMNLATGILAALVLAGALLLTQSRAGLLAVGVGTLAAILLLPFPRTLRIGAGTAAILAIVAGLWAVNAGRGLESLVVRLDYWRVSLGMMLERPLDGVGWGEFFHGYTRLKTFPGTEAPHDPHNLIFTFAAQCGVPGLLAALAALVAPLAVAWRACRRTPYGSPAFRLNAAIFAGWAIWAAHAMADLNLQIPGTVATALLLIPLLDWNGAEKDDDAAPGWLRRLATPRRLAVLWLALAAPLAVSALVIGWRRCRAEAAYQALAELCEPRFKTQEEYFRTPPAEMERALAACLARMPRSPFPWRLAMDFAVARNNWPAAERFAAEAAARAPNRASSHYHLAVARLQLGRTNDAIASLRHAANLFPNHDGYRTLLARLETDPRSPIPLDTLREAAR